MNAVLRFGITLGIMSENTLNWVPGGKLGCVSSCQLASPSPDSLFSLKGGSSEVIFFFHLFKLVKLVK